jgi:hypothetical protein
MRRIVVALLLIAVVTLPMPVAPTMAQAPNPATVVDAYTAAINAGNVDAALEFVADNAVYMRPAGQFVGKDQVRGFIQELVSRGAAIELLGEREVYGEYVTWRSRVAFGSPGAGPAEVRNLARSVVIDGKIVFHMATPAP